MGELLARDEKKENLWRKIDFLFFALLLLGVSLATHALFRQQVLSESDMFPSDMKAYVLEIQGLNEKYSFPYPILFWMGKLLRLFTTPELAMASATMLLNSLGMVAMKWMLDGYFRKEFPHAAGPARLVLSFLAVSLFFISMIYFPGHRVLPGIRFKYVGVFSPNPFHNATYMAARPFAILSFFSFAGLFKRYGEEDFLKNNPEDVKRCLFFAAALLLATMAKPSFTVILVATAGLKMLWSLIYNRFRNLKVTILLGLCFVPTFLDLLYQYKGVFVASDEAVEAGIGFSAGEVWGQYCASMPNSILLAMAFPILVLLFHLRDFRTDSTYRFSWQIYAAGFCTAYFLYEKGFRRYDFNFSWGYMYGLFFGFVGALLVLLRSTQRLFLREEAGRKTGRKEFALQAIVLLQWLVFLVHLICGIVYFCDLLQGETYY